MSNEWVSVEDRLPEVGESVLVWMSSGNFKDIDILEREEGDNWNNKKTSDVTHWQPLPKPPSESQSPVEEQDEAKTLLLEFWMLSVPVSMQEKAFWEWHKKLQTYIEKLHREQNDDNQKIIQ